MRKFSLALMCMLLVSCEMLETSTTAITILVDRTDVQIPVPNSEMLLPFIAIDEDVYDGVILKYQTIGDVDYSPVYQLELPQSSLLENTLQRNAEINRFYGAVDTLFIRENNKAYSYKRSSILFSLVSHLEQLEQLETNNRSLFLLSDLVEFSDIYNSYANSDFVIANPQKVALELKGKVTIPKTSAIDIYVLYFPKTKEENRLFGAWRTVYEELFKDSNCTLHFGIPQTLKINTTSDGN